MTISFIGCSGNIPIPERPVEVWNGAPDAVEGPSICRIKRKDLLNLVDKYKDTPKEVLDKIIINDEEVVCIPTHIDYFKEFGCMTFDDIAVQQRFIESLIKELRNCQANQNKLE